MQTSPGRSLATSVLVVLAGAAWGTGTAILATAIAVGQEGMFLPMFLALGPLLFVTERMPIPVTGFVLLPALYAVTTAALWGIERGRRWAAVATLLYASLLAGPAIGMTAPYWGEAGSIDLSRELEETADAARDVSGWFTLMAVGLVGWHTFAWRRLAKFWCADERSAAVRWLAVGTAAGLFAAVLAWLAQSFAEGSDGNHIPALLALGPFVLLELVVGPNSRGVFTLSAAAGYSVLGLLLAAARERRGAFWPAAVAFGLFAIGTIGVCVLIEVVNPGTLFGESRDLGRAVAASPALFAFVMAGIIGWQAYAVGSLWRSRAPHA